MKVMNLVHYKFLEENTGIGCNFFCNETLGLQMFLHSFIHFIERFRNKRSYQSI